ncbi:MAG: prolyl oligopeptidase family serine peptidase [Chloroflexi bacterium]|nr:prolyl oligopeptidase family serine peptidase [Chloroflexota bacterium]MCI0648945.1 prolyl oligopeptidase family serine peptidase [Chloroflexota bacterium]
MKEPQFEDGAPWKRRFRAPVILWSQLAAQEPARGLVCTNQSGMYQLYAWDVPTGELRQVTDRPEGMDRGLLSPDGRYVYYLDDEGGNEQGHYVRLPLDGGPAETLSPELPPYSSFNISLSRTNNFASFVVSDTSGYHLYGLDLPAGGHLGRPRLLYSSPRLFWGPSLSAQGELAVIDSSERSGKLQYSLVALDTSSGQVVAELWEGPESSLNATFFSPLPGDLRVLAKVNRGDEETLLLWSPLTGKQEELALGGMSGTPNVYDWSADGRWLLLSAVDRARQQLSLYELESGVLTRLEPPAGTFEGPLFAPGGEIFVRWQDAAHPKRLIALDPATGRMTRTVLAAGDVPPGRPWRSISLASAGGQEVQGWLGLPEGEGPFPAVIDLIGGPHGVALESFVPPAQMWLDHGLAYLRVNYRGNTSFGRAFREQIWGQPGRWEVEDVAAARNWLVAEGIARPDQMLLTGWSYGGFLVLLALGKQPELWAGGLAGQAISDWRLAYELSNDMIKGYLANLFGGTPKERPEQYAASSPMSYVEQVRAPVLIIQGRNDSRTPDRPVEIYAGRLAAQGKEVEVHWYDAGHNAEAQVEQSIYHHELMLRFAWRVLR